MRERQLLMLHRQPFGSAQTQATDTIIPRCCIATVAWYSSSRTSQSGRSFTCMQMEPMARRCVFKLESPFQRATILSLIQVGKRWNVRECWRFWWQLRHAGRQSPTAHVDSSPPTLCTPHFLSVSKTVQGGNRSPFSSPLRPPHAVFALKTTALDRQGRTKETYWYVGLEIARKAYVFLVANRLYSRKSSGMAFGQETLIV